MIKGQLSRGYPLLEGRGCRKRYTPQTSTIKKANVVLLWEGTPASWLPDSEEPHVPGPVPRRQREMEPAHTAMPPEQGGQSISRVNVLAGTSTCPRISNMSHSKRRHDSNRARK